MAIRKTKIVCTIGPAANSEAKIRELMLAGMDVDRLNFSHGDHASHLATLGLIVEEEGMDTHAAIVGMTLDIPVLLGVKNATQLLKQGTFVTIDGRQGIVCANK